MAQALINTKMLTWARERSGISTPEFARKCHVSEERLAEWEAGTRPITFSKAKEFAAKSHIPFGYLYLPKPPLEELPIPDLRTLEGRGVGRPSAELIDLLKLMLERQSWYREYLQKQLSPPCPYVGRRAVTDGTEVLVGDMRSALGVRPHPERGSWETYYRDLVGRIEALGVLVMRQSNLGHHTRPLSVEEFRGFAVADEYAPILFINDADAPGARLFTLIHELCHIWTGQSGVSDASPQSGRREEVLCNAVAAEFLVPAEEFAQQWRATEGDWRANLPELEAHFHVSKWVLARRALTLGYIQQDDYQRYIAEEKAAWERKKSEGSGAPSPYKVKKAQISKPFSKAVVAQALSRQLPLREAQLLLGGIKPANITKFAKELGV